MKKNKVLGIGMLVTAALLVISTGVVFASGLYQGSPPFDSENNEDSADAPYWEPMHGRGWRRDSEDEYPQMRSAMIEALSGVTDYTIEEIEQRLNNGDRLFTIAQDAGLDEQAFFDLMSEVRESYFATALEEGRITEEQYQWRLEHMQREWDEDGFEGCPHFNEGRPGFNQGRPRFNENEGRPGYDENHPMFGGGFRGRGGRN